MTNSVFNFDTKMVIDSLGLNDAGACWVTIHLLKEYITDHGDDQSLKGFADWIHHKYEQSDYDELE